MKIGFGERGWTGPGEPKSNGDNLERRITRYYFLCLVIYVEQFTAITLCFGIDFACFDTIPSSLSIMVNQTCYDAQGSHREFSNI